MMITKKKNFRLYKKALLLLYTKAGWEKSFSWKRNRLEKTFFIKVGQLAKN